MDSTLLSRVEPLFLVAFAIMALLWLATSTFVVVNRLLHDRRKRRFAEIGRSLTDPAVAALPPLQRSPAVRRLLSRLPRRAVYRLVADREVPPWVIEICAAYLLERVGLDQMTRDAAPQVSRRRKWRRIPALLALGHLRPGHVHDVLRTAVADADLDIANAAATALHRLGDLAAASILVSSLGRVPLPASRIATRLDQFPIPIGDLLRPLLVDPSSEVRYWGVSLLMRYGGAVGLAEEVAPLTDDPHPPVRKAAMLTLGEISPDAGASAAERNLTHPVAFVRSTAIRVLAQCAARASGVTRRQAIASTISAAMGDADWIVRAAAKEGLVLIGPTVWRQVAVHLDSTDGFARNGAAEVLQNLGVLDWAARRLGRGEALDGDLAGVMSRALEAGGATMADAVARRSSVLPVADLEEGLFRRELEGAAP